MKKVTKKTAKRKKPDTHVFTPKEAKAVVEEYAESKGVTFEEAQCALIATGWKRIVTLRKYTKKGGAK